MKTFTITQTPECIDGQWFCSCWLYLRQGVACSLASFGIRLNRKNSQAAEVLVSPIPCPGFSCLEFSRDRDKWSRDFDHYVQINARRRVPVFDHLYDTLRHCATDRTKDSFTIYVRVTKIDPTKL